MLREQPPAGSFDSTSSGGELINITTGTARRFGGAMLGFSSTIITGGRELMHSDTRAIHLPRIIIDR